MFWLAVSLWARQDEPARRAAVHRWLVGISGGDIEAVAEALPEPARQPLRDLVVALVNWK